MASGHPLHSCRCLTPVSPRLNARKDTFIASALKATACVAERFAGVATAGSHRFSIGVTLDSTCNMTA